MPEIDSASFEVLLAPLARAEDAVSRLDERMRSPLAEGLKARLEFQEACAWAWNRGQVVHLVDLVLHDDDLDIRMPDPELTRTHAMLRIWRRVGKLSASELSSPAGVLRFVGNRGARLSRAVARGKRGSQVLPGEGSFSAASTGGASLLRENSGTVFDELLAEADGVTTEDDAAALEAWFGLRDAIPVNWPALLRSAVQLEAWTVIDPLPRHDCLGAALVNASLFRSQRLRRHRLNVELGRRSLTLDGPRRPTGLSGLRRVIWWLQVLAKAEETALAEFDRLSLAHQVVVRAVTGRRESSRLPDAIDLFVRKPIVTAPMIADQLKITQQAARTLVRSLGTGVTEITGRRRFRAWRL